MRALLCIRFFILNQKVFCSSGRFMLQCRDAEHVFFAIRIVITPLARLFTPSVSITKTRLMTTGRFHCTHDNKKREWWNITNNTILPLLAVLYTLMFPTSILQNLITCFHYTYISDLTVIISSLPNFFHHSIKISLAVSHQPLTLPSQFCLDCSMFSSILFFVNGFPERLVLLCFP